MQFFTTLLGLVACVSAYKVERRASASTPYSNYETQFMTLTNSLGVVTGQPTPVLTQPTAITTQPQVETSQAMAATYSDVSSGGYYNTPAANSPGMTPGSGMVAYPSGSSMSMAASSMSRSASMTPMTPTGSSSSASGTPARSSSSASMASGNGAMATLPPMAGGALGVAGLFAAALL